MKNLGWILLGLVIGFLVGGVGPRAEGAAERASAARLQDELVKATSRASRCGGGAALLPGIGDLLPQRPAVARDPGPAPDPERAVDDAPPDRDGPAPDPAVVEIGADGGAADAAPLGRDAGYEAAVEAQRIRAEQSRAALAEQADLSDSELAEVDAIVGEMNDRLAEYADEMVAIIESGEEPVPRDMLGLTHDITGILYESQSRLEDTVGADRLPGVDPEAAAVWNYLDLGILGDALGPPVDR